MKVVKDEKLVELVKCAARMPEKSYAPYSHFHVGAALLCDDGSVYTGCNVENAAFGPSICAERVAVFKAVSEGHRAFKAIAVVGGREGVLSDYCPPCGVCRQVLAEFCDPETFEIILAKSADDSEPHSYLLKELLPLGFGSDNL